VVALGGPGYRQLLGRAETFYRSSAATLRTSGQHVQAAAAEQYAAWVRFHLEDPHAAGRMRALTEDLRDAAGLGQILPRALERAMSLLAAERGNLQILDPQTGALVIAAQHGFGGEFLEHFAEVRDGGATCGRALSRQAQIVIADVTTDSAFAVHRDIAAASGFRAVQSTPLTDGAGRVVGVLSTHYPDVHRPPDRELRIMRHYGEFLGHLITCYRRGADPPRTVGAGP
jgi:GAF domain-containing protein